MPLKRILHTAVFLLCIASFTAAQGCTVQTSQQSEDVSHDTISSDEVESKAEYTEYLKEFGIDFSEIVASEEGEIIQHDAEQDFASLRFEIKEGLEETARNRISERYGKELDEEDIIYPGSSQDKYLQMVNSENIIASWYGFKNGTKGAMTRSFQIFLTENDNTYFVYFFG